jgi:hypothetical protein
MVLILLLSVEIKAVTWEKDSHGLFDYEFKHTDIRKFSVTETTSFARIGITISFYTVEIYACIFSKLLNFSFGIIYFS